MQHELVIAPQELAAALRFVTRSAVVRKPKVPILATVKLDCEGDKATLTATNLDWTVSASIDLTRRVGTQNFSALINPRIFLTMADGEDEPITLRFDDAAHEGSLSAGHCRLDFREIVRVDDWPEWRNVEWKHSATLSEGYLHDTLAVVRRAISREETRFYLNGIYFHASRRGAPNTLALVATDGHRLELIETGERWGGGNLIVPNGAISALSDMTKSGGNTPVHIDTDDLQLRVTCGSRSVVTKCIDGTFPDYTRVIPKMDGDPKIRAEVARAAARKILRVGRSFGPNGSLCCKIDPAQKRMTLASFEGSGTIEAPASGEGEPFGLNAAYLVDLLGSSEIVSLRAASVGAPILARFEDPSRTAVIMPMRT